MLYDDKLSVADQSTATVNDFPRLRSPDRLAEIPRDFDPLTPAVTARKGLRDTPIGGPLPMKSRCPTRARLGAQAL